MAREKIKIQLREIKNLDFDKVTDIFFETGCLKHQNRRKVYKKAVKKAFLNSDYVVSSWDGNKLVGFSRVVCDQSIFGIICNLIVKPEYQNKGIGNKLIKKCLAKYPQLHFFLIGGEKVVSFYQRLGFKLHPYGMFLEKGKKVCAIYN